MIRFRNLDRSHFLEGTVSVNPPSVGAGAVNSVDVTITGLTTSHRVLALPQAALSPGLVISGLSIPSENTLRIHLHNPSGVSVDGGAVTWAYFAWLGR